MTKTLTIRLDPEDRATLEKAAHEQGKGLSAYLRELAEVWARQLRQQAIRAEGARVVAYLARHPEAQAELEELGTPLADIP